MSARCAGLAQGGAVFIALAATVFISSGTTVVNAADAADAANASIGAKAYAHRCRMCHGPGQTGTFLLARRLGAEKSLLEQRRDLTPVYIRQVVRSGLVNMPRISRVEMPDADLDAVIAYLTQKNAAP